jgi:hypothetical protein
VSVDKPIIHNFIKKLSPGDPRRAFPTSVVESSLEAFQLPEQMNSATRVLCEIQSDLSSADERRFTEKNRRFWNLGKHYFKVEYQVRVLIGPADIRFELWFDEQKLSRDRSIKVDWLPAPVPDIAIYNRAELPETRSAGVANPLAAHPRGDKSISDQRGYVGTAGHTGDGKGVGSERKWGLGKMQGVVSMAKNTKWST